jgi:hypothetical protein
VFLTASAGTTNKVQEGFYLFGIRLNWQKICMRTAMNESQIAYFSPIKLRHSHAHRRLAILNPWPHVNIN